MARLPVPGGDSDEWGQVLNDFLSVEHNNDGTLILHDVITATKAKADAAVTQSSIGQAGGIAALGNDGKVPTGQLPAVVSQPVDGSAATPSLRTLGVGASQAVSGTDIRLPNLTGISDGDLLRWDATNNRIAKSTKPWFNVRDFGAVGDGVTDDSAAFVACRDAMAATQHVSPWGVTSNNVTRAAMYIPPGEYVITTPNAMMNGQGGARANGWTVMGAGKDVTRIRFNPTDPGSGGAAYLVNNADKYSWLHFSSMTFTSTIANASFMNSFSNGVAGYYFEHVRWEGLWRYGLYLTGTNTNSEMTFTKCEMSGSYVAFLYIPSAPDGNDQFLDYDFLECASTLNSGNFIDIAMGGDVNIWGGSYSINGNGTSSQVLLALRGGNHASGVCRALVIGARIELKHPLAQAVYCEWKVGNVNFYSIDMGSQAFTEPATNITAEFAQSSGPGANVIFDGCSLPGQHLYHIGTSSWQYPRRITYTNSDISQWTHAADFITYTVDSTIIDKGSYPAIRFQNCRSLLSGSTGINSVLDCILNWQNNNMAQTVERVLNVHDGYGLPSGSSSLTFSLPINSVITKIIFDHPVGSGTSAINWSYTITDGDSNVVVTYAPGTAWNAAFHTEITAYRTLATTTQRTLTMGSTNLPVNDVNSKYVTCLIYYIA